MPADDANLWLGAIGALLVVVQLGIRRRQARLVELQALHDLRTRWIDLRPEWQLTLAAGGSMYVTLDDQTVTRFPEAGEYRDAFADLGAEVTKRANSVTQLPSPLEQPVRDCLDFLSLACTSILRGRTSPATVYEALGPSLVRNGGPIRRLIDEPNRTGYYLGYYRGVADRIRILVDLLWVEAVRAGDLQDYELERSFEAKAPRITQRRNRRRMRPYGLRLGGRFRTIRLEWHLTYAEVPLAMSRPWRLARRAGRMISGMRPPRSVES